MKKKELLRRIEVLEKRYATEEEKALLEPKKELEVGRWYWLNDRGNKALIFNINNKKGYGFGWDNSWTEKFNIYNVSLFKQDFTEATPQEVEKALIEEAKRRGIHPNAKLTINTTTIYNHGAVRNVITKDNCFRYENNHLEILTKSGAYSIFKDGKWCNVIKNDDKPQVGDVCKFWDEDEDNFAIGALNSTDFSQLYPYEMKSLACGFRHAKKLTEQEVIDLLFKK